MSSDRLAVLIGSQSRGLQHTNENINFFLKLFNIPYDVYICSDDHDLDNFSGIENVKECVSLEQVECENRWMEGQKSIMHKHYWQNAKLFGVATLFKHKKHEYTHALKMRTDFMFDYRTYFTNNRLNPDDIEMKHLEYMFDDFRLHRHHCNMQESRAWKNMYAPDSRVVPLLYNGDRFIFSSAEKLWKYCFELMRTAVNIRTIYKKYYNIPMQHDYMDVKKHLETISIPCDWFPAEKPANGEVIAKFLNKNREFLKEYNSQKTQTNYYHPILTCNDPHAGKDIFCNGNFNADVLAFINQLYVPYIKPSKHGFVKYMHFTRYGDNVKFGEEAGMTIKQAFHDDDVTYRDSITLQNKLIELYHVSIT